MKTFMFFDNMENSCHTNKVTVTRIKLLSQEEDKSCFYYYYGGLVQVVKYKA